MIDVQNEAGRKIIISFVIGLLIGGILVWAFTGDKTVDKPSASEKNDTDSIIGTNKNVSNDNQNQANIKPTDTNTQTKEITTNLAVGAGEVVVADQLASTIVVLKSATYPLTEGWIGVRDYTNENLGSILGVVRFSETQDLLPKDIILQRSTVRGSTYAVVIFSDDGDRQFNSAGDVQIDKIFATFTAQ